MKFSEFLNESSPARERSTRLAFSKKVTDGLDAAGGDPEKERRFGKAIFKELYKKYGCSIVAIEEIPKEDTNKYGVIAGNEIEPGIYMVKDMVEKPEPEVAPSNLAIIGRYILTPDIFNIIRETKPGKGGEIQITDALLTQAKNGMVLAYKFKGERFDCGSIDGFVKATNYFYDKSIKNEKKEEKKDNGKK
jgi:UTP--glucose-1-phosphate uridylyltransferase